MNKKTMSVNSVSAGLGNSNRDVFWDCAKGLAIICVVLQHLLEIIDVKNNLFVATQYLHMPVFFFVSGHFAYKNIVGESLGTIVKKKAKRLLVPYLAWTCIAVAPKILGANAKSAFACDEVSSLDCLKPYKIKTLKKCGTDFFVRALLA